MSLSNSEILLVNRNFIEKYHSKRDLFSKDANAKTYYETLIQQKDLTLDAQYKRMFSINGDTASITINGGMSNAGADWVDVYLGYDGTSYLNIIKAFDEAIAAKVKRIEMKVNTPGGNIIGLEEASQKIDEAKSLGIEVIAYNHGQIASAGVWLVAKASKIYPKVKTAQIGSIGVVVEGYDTSEYYKKMGIEVFSITNTDSPNKRVDLTKEDGKAILRKELDSIADVFFKHIADGRNLSEQSIRDLKGEMIISYDAVSIGLMDESPNTDQTGSKASIYNKPKMEKAMTEQELKVLSESIANAVSAAVAPIQKEMSSLKESIEAQKQADSKDAERKSKFSAISGKFPEMKGMIESEMNAGKECSADFVLSVVEADSARKAESEKLNKNAQEAAPHIEAENKQGEEKSAKAYDSLLKKIRG